MKLLRFRDLQERQIVANWAQLGNLVQKYGFPPGRMISDRARAWTEGEIDGWLASRPIVGPAPLGAAKLRSDAARRDEAARSGLARPTKRCAAAARKAEREAERAALEAEGAR